MTKIKKVKTEGSNKDGQTFVVSSSNSFYDDCPICQAMKKAEEEGRSLSEEELKEAFAKANKKRGLN